MKKSFLIILLVAILVILSQGFIGLLAAYVFLKGAALFELAVLSMMSLKQVYGIFLMASLFFSIQLVRVAGNKIEKNVNAIYNIIGVYIGIIIGILISWASFYLFNWLFF